MNFLFLLLFSLHEILRIEGFNLDVFAPIYKFGVRDTHFGYSVAEHIKGRDPV